MKRGVLILYVMVTLVITLFLAQSSLIVLVNHSTKEIETEFTMQTAHINQTTTNKKVSNYLNLYIGKEGRGIPYVDLNEFYNFLQPAIYEQQRFFIDYHKQEWIMNLDKTKQVVIDFDKQTIMIDDLLILDEISSIYKPTRGSIKIEDIQKARPIEIDLAKYKITIELKDGHYLVPLYLANYLMAGYDMDVTHIYDGEHEIIISSPNDYFYGNAMDDGFQYQHILNNEEVINVQNASVQFLKLIFDEFYGLNEINVARHIELPPLEIDTMDTANYLNQMYQYVDGLQDLHTNIIQKSYLYEENLTSIERSSNYRMNYQNAYSEAQCPLAPRSIAQYYEIDDSLYIEVFGFKEELAQYLEDNVPNMSNYSNVFIDIRCNSGGYISYINSVMKYLSADVWSIVSSSLNGGRHVWEFPNGIKTNPKPKFYLVTSNYTYSAANLLSAVVSSTKVATIVGERSRGGAAAIDFLSLPDGTVLSYSGPFYIFSTAIHEDIEKGIEVEIPIQFLDLANQGSDQDYHKKWDEMRQIADPAEGFYLSTPSNYSSYEAFIGRIINQVLEETK